MSKTLQNRRWMNMMTGRNYSRLPLASAKRFLVIQMLAIITCCGRRTIRKESFPKAVGLTAFGMSICGHLMSFGNSLLGIMLKMNGGIVARGSK